jgi:hypothetical protein
VLLKSRSRGGGSEFGPKSLEDCPGSGRICETKLGEVLEGRARRDLQSRVLLGNLEAGQELFVGLDSASQQGGGRTRLDVLNGVGSFNCGIGCITTDEVAGYKK